MVRRTTGALEQFHRVFHGEEDHSQIDREPDQTEFREHFDRLVVGIRFWETESDEGSGAIPEEPRTRRAQPGNDGLAHEFNSPAHTTGDAFTGPTFHVVAGDEETDRGVDERDEKKEAEEEREEVLQVLDFTREGIQHPHDQNAQNDLTS